MDLDLDKLQAICDAATPGPWYSDGEHGWADIDDVTVWDSPITDEGFSDSVDPEKRWIGNVNAHPVVACNPNMQSKSDGLFIATARTAVPELIARVRELEDKVGEYGDGIELVNEVAVTKIRVLQARIAELERVVLPD